MAVYERMANAVAKHMLRMGADDGRIDSVQIFPQKTDRDGWTEWLLKYEFASGGQLTVGAILRNPDQVEVEFHS